MTWTHEQIKTFPTKPLIGEVAQENFWLNSRIAPTLFVNVYYDGVYLNIISGYRSSGSLVSPMEKWCRFIDFSIGDWNLVITPMTKDYDPEQQPWEEGDI